MKEREKDRNEEGGWEREKRKNIHVKNRIIKLDILISKNILL